MVYSFYIGLNIKQVNYLYSQTKLCLSVCGRQRFVFAQDRFYLNGKKNLVCLHTTSSYCIVTEQYDKSSDFFNLWFLQLTATKSLAIGFGSY